MLHSGNIGNISTAFRSDDSDGMRGAAGSREKPGPSSGNGGVHLTSQINFRTNHIPYANTIVENYKREAAKDHYSFYLGANTLTSFPNFDSRFANKVTMLEINS